jgi:uncharacterized protein YkwD
VYNIDLTPPAVVTEVRAEALAELNRRRAEAGVAPLVLDDALNAAAQARADTVAATDDLTSLEATRDEVGRRVQSAGYEHRLVSEVVLWGEVPFATRLNGLRQNEPSLFADAMDKDYRDLGIGLAEGDHGLVRVLIFGLSLRDDFASRTAALADLAQVRAQMLASVNAARKAVRLPPMRESPLLDQAAQAHAQDMIRRSYYGHDSPEGTNAMARAGRVHYAAAAIGENVAEGQSTVAEVMTGWMASPVHRDHIVSLVLKEIGIGMAFGKNARGYEIVWVQMFGAPAR